MQFAAGTKLGNFEIQGLMGLGAMGEVYRARDLKLGRDVALKVVRQPHTATEKMLVRFQREAQMLAALNHPGIAAIYGFEEARGCQFLVMELAPGPTLAERLAHGPLPPREMLGIAIQMCEALSAAHEKGIVHRDLKPANLKITPGGRVKILDFGLAKSVGLVSADTPNVDPARDVTQEGMIVGTPSYMSPEQAAGKPVDRRTDIWSFGCVLFEMCSGRPPFVGESSLNTIALILERDPDWTKLPTATHHRIKELLERRLRKDAARRLHDLGDARIELEEVRKEIAAAPPLPTELQGLAQDDPLATTGLEPGKLPRDRPSDTEALPPGPTTKRTPTGPTETDASTAQPKWPAGLSVRIILLLVLAVLLAVLAYAVYDLLAPRETVAVLAFTVPQRSTPELEGLIKGIREKTVAGLRASSPLKRGGYQTTPAGIALGGRSPGDVGRELGARLILAGDVTADGNNGLFKIHLALIDTKLLKTLWTKTYVPERAPDSAVTAQQWQDDIAQDAARSVQDALAKK